MDQTSKDSGTADPAVMRTMALEAGTRLDIIDASQPLTGDRWRVAAVFRLVIPISETICSSDPVPLDFQEVRDRLGEHIVFEKRLERIFIGADEKEAIYEDMVSGYLDGALGYLARPAFARNFVRRQYAEALQKIEWYPEDESGPDVAP